jgi:hypothetical protein
MLTTSGAKSNSPWTLALEPQSVSRVGAVLARTGSQPISVWFESLGGLLETPKQLDGFLALVLPALLRADGAVHVAGTLTREILRNLTDASEGWEDWNADRYRALHITADHIIDPPVPTFSPRAVFAWSGSLRSTHTLVRHFARRVPGDARVARIVHVVGLQGDAGLVSAESIAAEVNNRAERLGAPVECVLTNLRDVVSGEAEMGLLHVAAAALHLTARDLRLAFHARGGPVSAQLRYPRPEPAFPDVFCGSRLLVRADGGSTTPTQMVREVREHAPFLLDAISGCTKRPRFTPPCGACSGCIITSLAFAAAGVPYPALPQPTASDVERLQWRDSAVAAEATEIASDWSLPGTRVHRALCRRVERDRASVTRAEIGRWLASAAGVGPIWPR